MSQYINPLHAPVMPSQVSTYTALGGALGGTTGRPTAHVEQRHIVIDYIGKTGQGVPMHELKKGGQSIDMNSNIAGANDIVLICQKVELRVMWPGYSVKWARTIEANGPLTRFQFAQKVACAFATFTETMDVYHPCTSPAYQISSARIQFPHLRLLELRSTCGGVWDALVAIDFDQRS